MSLNVRSLEVKEAVHDDNGSEQVHLGKEGRHSGDTVTSPPTKIESYRRSSMLIPLTLFTYYLKDSLLCS